ncbi:MAG TPA: hypothetical protein VIV60_37515 [Polyangiaceae bacterium]
MALADRVLRLESHHHVIIKSVVRPDRHSIPNGLEVVFRCRQALTLGLVINSRHAPSMAHARGNGDLALGCARISPESDENVTLCPM